MASFHARFLVYVPQLNEWGPSVPTSAQWMESRGGPGQLQLVHHINPQGKRRPYPAKPEGI